jgi:hypothetical protein
MVATTPPERPEFYRQVAGQNGDGRRRRCLASTGEPGVAKLIGDEEVVFVLPPDAVRHLPDRVGLEAALEAALGRKV